MQKNKISNPNTHQNINIKIALKVSSIGILLYPLSFFISSVFLYHASSIPPKHILTVIAHSIIFIISFLLCYISSKVSSGSIVSVILTSAFSLLIIYIHLFLFTKGIVSIHSLYIILNMLMSTVSAYLISTVIKKRK